MYAAASNIDWGPILLETHTGCQTGCVYYVYEHD